MSCVEQKGISALMEAAIKNYDDVIKVLVEESPKDALNLDLADEVSVLTRGSLTL